MKVKATIIILCFILFSCNKDNTLVTLNGTLTDCPANFACTYFYYNQADFTSLNQVVPGGDMVFAYNSINANLCGLTNQLYFKTSTSNNDFDISASQIAGGQVNYNTICACCNVILLKPIGGEIKGKRTDATHWLVNATVILGNASNKAIDTLTVNQYFVLKTL
jgi:hypothetical protein